MFGPVFFLQQGLYKLQLGRGRCSHKWILFWAMMIIGCRLWSFPKSCQKGNSYYSFSLPLKGAKVPNIRPTTVYFYPDSSLGPFQHHRGLYSG